MNIMTTAKISLITAFSVFSSVAFAGEVMMPPVSVSEPGILALMGLGVAAVLYIAKKRK